LPRFPASGGLVPGWGKTHKKKGNVKRVSDGLQKKNLKRTHGRKQMGEKKSDGKGCREIRRRGVSA